MCLVCKAAPIITSPDNLQLLGQGKGSLDSWIGLQDMLCISIAHVQSYCSKCNVTLSNFKTRLFSHKLTWFPKVLGYIYTTDKNSSKFIYLFAHMWPISDFLQQSECDKSNLFQIRQDIMQHHIYLKDLICLERLRIYTNIRCQCWCYIVLISKMATVVKFVSTFSTS